MAPIVRKTPQQVNDALAEAILEHGKSPVAEALAEQARKGIYSDFSSPLVFPKTVCVTELEACGLFSVANRVKAGEFDG